MAKHNCKACGKEIKGRLRIHTYRKETDGKSVVVVDLYDDRCYKLLKKERAKDGSCKQKRTRKAKNKKRA